MTSSMKTNKTDNESSRRSCCYLHSASAWCSWLKRRCLLAVLIICMLMVMLLFDRWVLLSPSQTFNYPRVLKVSTLIQGCSDETPSRCIADQSSANSANSGRLNSNDEGAADFSTRCSSDVIAQLAENVYSDDAVPVRRLPQYLIIGVQKGGTGALLEFLNLHPDVRAPEDEIHFFDREKKYSRGLEWYRRQMPATHASQITVEKSARYIILDQLVSRIYQMNSSIRLLVTFRDPVERAISGYLQMQSRLKNHHLPPLLSFERMVISNKTGDIDDTYDAVMRSMYDVHMKWWLQYFSLDQFHFVSAEDLVANPVHELQRVEKFLGIRHILTKDLFYFDKTKGFYCMCVNLRKLDDSQHKGVMVEQTCLPERKGRKHPSIDPNVLNKLRNFFRPHNERLYKMIGINFGWK